jgi:hypothetical protein
MYELVARLIKIFLFIFSHAHGQKQKIYFNIVLHLTQTTYALSKVVYIVYSSLIRLNLS